MSRCAVAYVVLACLALPAAAQGTTPAQRQAAPLAAPAAPASQIGPEVMMVRVTGPWNAGGQTGFSRLIATAAGGRISLSVQWISNAGQIVQAVAVPAPQGAEGLPIARVRGETGPSDSAVYFDTPDGDTFVLTVGGPGHAQFGPATN